MLRRRKDRASSEKVYLYSPFQMKIPVYRMGYFSHRVDRDQIKRGDHIYTWRTAFTYAHHGIYVGENKVIHFTAPQTATSDSGWNFSSGFSYSSNNTCNCRFQQSKHGVTVSCLSCFIGSGSVYLYQYAVNMWSCVFEIRGGTCTLAQSDPPDAVIYRAIYLLENGFGDYSMFRNNCEDFALYCKTGLLVSGKASTGCSGQANFFFNGPWNKYRTDIGVRDDVVKVKVEDVALFR